MADLLNRRQLYRPPDTTQPAPLSKGKEIMEGLILGQYKDSPYLQEYMMAFISELDFLFETTSLVHSGRFLETAVGVQLDGVGVLLNQKRSVILPNIWFGFQGALNVDKMSDESAPAEGGLFKDENVGTGDTTPLDDTTYRKMLVAKAMLTNRDSADLSLTYYVVSILLGRVPSVFRLEDADTPGSTLNERTVELVVSRDDTTTREVQLILYMAKYFVPVGITFLIRQV